MKVAKPRVRRKHNKIYYVIESHVSEPTYHVILNKYEWSKILVLYDSFLEILHYAEKYCWKWLNKLDIDRKFVLGELENIEARLNDKELSNDKLVILVKVRQGLIRELEYINEKYRETEMICREITKWSQDIQYLWARHDKLWREIIEKYGNI